MVYRCPSFQIYAAAFGVVTDHRPPQLPQVLTLFNRFSASAETSHRKWHSVAGVSRRGHTFCPRHDRLQLPARLHPGAGGGALLWQHHLQGTTKSEVVSLSVSHVLQQSRMSFLNLIIILMTVDNVGIDWQVSVTAREDVPPFGPPLPSPSVFKKVRKTFGEVLQNKCYSWEHQIFNNWKPDL